MTIYNTLEDGNLSSDLHGFIPVGHRFHAQALTEVEAGDSTILDYVAPLPSAVQVRNDALQALVYDFGDGRIIQTRPQDESNIRNAIEVMDQNSIPTIGWVMQDNIKHDVTSTELSIALAAGQVGGMAVWNAYTPD